MKEKNTGGTPEKSIKSKSPDKPQAVIEPAEKTRTTQDSSEKKQSVTKETTDNQGKWRGLCLWLYRVGIFYKAFVGQDYKYIYCIKEVQYHSFIEQCSL